MTVKYDTYDEVKVLKLDKFRNDQAMLECEKQEIAKKNWREFWNKAKAGEFE